MMCHSVYAPTGAVVGSRVHTSRGIAGPQNRIIGLTCTAQFLWFKLAAIVALHRVQPPFSVPASHLVVR
jgi:hypothetical protein